MQDETTSSKREANSARHSVPDENEREVLMKKAMVNYWVDMITGVAFVLCAVTGLMRLFPEFTVSMSSGGQGVILGIPVSYWQTIHDWSGVVMAAGVGTHTVLHFKWLVSMTGKVLRGETKSARARAKAPNGAPQHGAPQGAAVASIAAPQQAAAPVPAGTDAHLARLAAMGAPTRPAHAGQRGYTRKGFLAAAGVVGAAALVAGWGIFGRGDDSTTATTSSGSSSATARASDASSSHNGYGNGYGDGSDSSSSSGSSASSGSTTTASSERVVIDADACTGCGRCVPACPYGILTMSGNKAVVQDADGCQLCGHCVRVCPSYAITLNA